MVNTHYPSFLIYEKRFAKNYDDVMEETHRDLAKCSALTVEQLKYSKMSC